MRKTIAALLVSAIICLTLSGCRQETDRTPESTGYVIQSAPQTAPEEPARTRIHENGRLTLYADLSDGTIEVEDRTTGRTWYSNPPDREDDRTANGFHKEALMSGITVTYTTDRSVSMSCASFTDCVEKKALSYCLEPDGSLIFIYYFPKENFYVPVRYAIGEDCLAVSVLSSYIMEDVDPNGAHNTIETIEVLPFFGAASKDDKGYMLVPDGCGALIYYNNERLTAATYDKSVYGFDSGTSEQILNGRASGTAFTVSETQYLPVFGTSCEENGFLAIISRSAPRASIKADIAGKYTNYNTIWPAYHYRQVGVVNQTQKNGEQTTVRIFEKSPETWCDFEVDYYFLATGASTYMDMASFYRDHLLGQGKLTGHVEEQEHIPLYLETFGYIEKTKSFLGIPHEAKIATGTIEDMENLIDELSQRGISRVVLDYHYWSDGSYFRKIPVSGTVDKTVGSGEQMLSLQDRLRRQGGDLFLATDLLNVYKTGRGVSRYSDVLRSVAGTAQLQYKIKLDTAEADSRYDAWYLLRPSSFARFFGEYADSLSSNGYEHLSLESVGTMLYSELCTGGTGRSFSQILLQEAVEAAAVSSGGLMAEGAADYVAVLASHVLDTSFQSSGYDIEDVSVPFYQAVFHGYVSYSLNASNLSSEPVRHTLECLEFGASPLFSLVTENKDELIGSRVDYLYSADASVWMDYIEEQYSQVDEVLAPVQSSVMTGHEILTDQVRRTTYANGISVYVNYGSEDFFDGNVTVRAGGYLETDAAGTVLSEGLAAGSLGEGGRG